MQYTITCKEDDTMKKLTLSALALILTLTLTLATTVAFAENALYDAVMERGSLIIGTLDLSRPGYQRAGRL